LVVTPEPMSDADVAAARRIAAATGMSVETRDEQTGLVTVQSVATALGAVAALGILAMSIGLIRAESGRDLQTLTASGATSTARRTLTATSAGALALLAVGLAIAVAYACMVAGYFGELDALRNPPLLHLAATLAGVPVAAWGAGWLMGGREPEHIAAARFE
jgi:putative ABC transport system permease protein